MNHAERLRVVLLGADKSEAALNGLQQVLSPSEFPVCGLQAEKAVWFVDLALAEPLKDKVPSAAIEFIA
jgi:hypothetical protein